MNLTPVEIGTAIRTTRKKLGITQADLALTAGTGIRFIGDLEKGKSTCEIGKFLTILNTLRIHIELIPPSEWEV